MKVRDVLESKGSRVVFVRPGLSLRDALSTMVDNKVGALPVLDAAGKVLGIITERDLMREVHACTVLEAKTVEGVMTRTVQSARLDDDLERVMGQMTEGRFRHVPIIEEGRMVGIVSIGDTVKAQLDHLQRQFENLRDYVVGATA